VKHVAIIPRTQRGVEGPAAPGRVRADEVHERAADRVRLDEGPGRNAVAGGREGKAPGAQVVGAGELERLPELAGDPHRAGDESVVAVPRLVARQRAGSF